MHLICAKVIQSLHGSEIKRTEYEKKKKRKKEPKLVFFDKNDDDDVNKNNMQYKKEK